MQLSRNEDMNNLMEKRISAIKPFIIAGSVLGGALVVAIIMALLKVAGVY